jgi:hypothetical protein
MTEVEENNLDPINAAASRLEREIDLFRNYLNEIEDTLKNTNYWGDTLNDLVVVLRWFNEEEDIRGRMELLTYLISAISENGRSRNGWVDRGEDMNVLVLALQDRLISIRELQSRLDGPQPCPECGCVCAAQAR